MAALDHWHPVLLSADLGAKPRAITLLGGEYVLFRGGAGGPVGALCDRCPHRGMRLSRGWVAGERLVCPYHGWSYDAAGHGESAGTPKLRVEADRLEVVERYGAVWVRALGSEGNGIPDLGFPGYYAVCTLEHRIDAPLELCLDNFCEVEHTPTTHAFLGYALESLASVETRVETTDDGVRVINRGPQKPIPFVLERLVGVYTGDVFVDDWTTRFSPVHAVYDQYWLDPVTGQERANRLKIAVFFTPITATSTALTTFVWSTVPPFGRLGLNGLLKRMMVLLVDREVKLDRAMVEALADKRPDLPGARLGRFDKALFENRRRLESIYRGVAPCPAAAE